MTKAIIKRRRYDTETAFLVKRSVGNGEPAGTYGYWEAALYRTKNDRWFLCGDGGPQSIFGKVIGNDRFGSIDAIATISKDHAREILEDVQAFEVLEKYFAIEEG